MIEIAYDTYQRASGSGEAWLCHCRENGKSRLVFLGNTESEAKAKATDWVNKNLDTPERREILKQRAEVRKRTLKRKAHD